MTGYLSDEFIEILRLVVIKYIVVSLRLTSCSKDQLKYKCTMVDQDLQIYGLPDLTDLVTRQERDLGTSVVVARHENINS